MVHVQAHKQLYLWKKYLKVEQCLMPFFSFLYSLHSFYSASLIGNIKIILRAHEQVSSDKAAEGNHSGGKCTHLIVHLKQQEDIKPATDSEA